MSEENTLNSTETAKDNAVIESTSSSTKSSTDKTTAKRTRTKKVAEESKGAIIESSVKEASEKDLKDEVNNVITGPEKKATVRASNVHEKEDGVIGSRAADKALSKKPEAVKEEAKEDKEEEKVAVWSKGNIRWTGVGALSKGYNIVNKEAADKWLTREGIREATPEEVATYYGK